jgi:hypothetical protein
LAYIGTIPAEAYTSFAVQHFTTSATDTFTLDFPVANENEIALFINNVRQEPGSGYAYTASGTTLTLASAITGSDSMYCVFIGKAVQTVAPAAGSVTNDMLAGSIATAKLASITANGITEADQWRVTANFTNASNGVDEDITSNWERADTTDFEKIGTGLTESSGIFSFPSTGKYFINAHSWFYQSQATSGGHFKLFVTTDNSTYNERAKSIGGGDSDRPVSLKFNSIIDCTDTSNVKFKFVTNGGTYITWQCSTNSQNTGFNIIRLGDT